MSIDWVLFGRVMVPVTIALIIIVPVTFYLYRLVQKFDKPMCRSCQARDAVVKYADLGHEEQVALHRTYERFGWKIGNRDETALCRRCKLILDEYFDDQGVVCRRCGTPMYLLDQRVLDPNALWCRPCNGLLTVVECRETGLRISDIVIDQARQPAHPGSGLDSTRNSTV